MAANNSIIDLTEDSFTEEYVSTGDNLRFEPPSRRSTGFSAADESLIFVGESFRRSEDLPRVPLRPVQQTLPVQRVPVPRGPSRKPKPKAKTVEKSLARAESPPQMAPSVDAPSAPTCPICMETFSEIKASNRTLMTTHCGHIFCSRCLAMVKKQKSTSTGRKETVQCPTCRKTWYWNSCHPIYL